MKLAMSQPSRSTAVPARSRSLPRSRREFLKVAGCGFGLLGLADLLARETRSRRARRAARSPAGPFAGEGQALHFPVHDRRPEPDGLFDPKPLLNRLDSQPLPPSFGKIHSQFLEADPLCLGSHRKWGKYGQSGMDMSDLVPHLHPMPTISRWFARVMPIA